MSGLLDILCKYLPRALDWSTTTPEIPPWKHHIGILVNRAERLQEVAVYNITIPTWDLPALRSYFIPTEHQRDWQRFLDILENEGEVFLRQTGQFYLYSYGGLPIFQIVCTSYDTRNRTYVPIYEVTKKMQ